ncbi:MFS transporter [Ferrovibrio sp.]|uniref:MFS transporter n=1 Tax=Ferrovibrio sp. TaxID=1917215 RepID=UPI003513274A
MVAIHPASELPRSPGHGWPVVAALSLAQVISWGTIFYGFPLFVVPMEAELGWGRSELNGAVSLGLLVSGLAAYPVGRLIDARGGRWLMTIGSALAGIMFLLWARVGSLPVFYALWFGLGIAQATTLYAPVFAVLTRMFPDDFRLRITILTLAGGFASTVFIPLIAWWIEALGWRDALLVVAACNLLLCLPVHGLLLRDHGRRDADAAPLPAAEDPMRRALRHPVFWGLAVCFTFYFLMHTMLAFHFIPMFAEYGLPLGVAVGILAVIGPAQVAGRVLLLFGRRLDAVANGIIVMALFMVSLPLLILFPTIVPVLFVFAALYGAANGMMTILRGTAVPDLLWREGYGAINGALTLPTALAAAVAPSLAAWIWGLGGGYFPVLVCALVFAMIAATAFGYAVLRRRRG